jgi:hypothetical protein
VCETKAGAGYTVPFVTDGVLQISREKAWVWGGEGGQALLGQTCWESHMMGSLKLPLTPRRQNAVCLLAFSFILDPNTHSTCFFQFFEKGRLRQRTDCLEILKSRREGWCKTH